ncbi:MAG: hypothetical protein ACXAC7_11435 [Candidatus Hodarchaeales archaeon]|jgi:hypothetical protein
MVTMPEKRKGLGEKYTSINLIKSINDGWSKRGTCIFLVSSKLRIREFLSAIDEFLYTRLIK